MNIHILGYMYSLYKLLQIGVNNVSCYLSIPTHSEQSYPNIYHDLLADSISNCLLAHEGRFEESLLLKSQQVLVTA